MDYLQFLPLFCMVLQSCFISKVSAASMEVVGLAVAGSLSFILLFTIIFFIAVSTSWSEWMNQWYRSRNKVKMPKIYWKKKEEAKRRLLMSGSSSVASAPNGQLPAQTVDRANWVQGWSQRSNAYNNVYEEKDVALDFGPEAEEEYKIETVLCDDEVLDVGPYSSQQADEQTEPSGDVYPDPYIYTKVDKSRSSVRETPAPPGESPQVETVQVDVESVIDELPPPESLEVNISNFEETLVKL